MNKMNTLLLFLHLISTLGAFGVLLMTQFGLSIEQRRGKAGKRGMRLTQFMLLVGLAAGMVLFVSLIRAGDLGPYFHMVVGTKFLLLLGAGACIGLASVKAKQEKFGSARWLGIATLVIMALAAALASTLG